MRHTLAYLAIALLVSVTSSGCFLYFDNDEECQFGGGADDPGPAVPAAGLRNPQSGQCEFFGGGPLPFPCDDVCGPCPEAGPTPTDGDQAPGVPAPAQPSWGFCDSQCSNLDEASCLGATGCRGIYSPEGLFRECWSVDMNGPVRDVTCAGLDAFACSLSDECIAVHDTDCDPNADPIPGFACGTGQFLACEAEPQGCFDSSECDAGYRCNAIEVCGTPPGCDPAVGCDSACYGVCVPDGPGDCHSELVCDSLPPDCPADSVPGRRDGCWTGQCVLSSQCEPPPPPAACVEVTDESTCIGRPECTALYQGVNCDCAVDGTCQCSDWVFEGCE